MTAKLIFCAVIGAVLVLNAAVLWCCCAINRKRSLSSSLATHAAPSEREPDSEKGRIANGCDFLKTGR